MITDDNVLKEMEKRFTTLMIGGIARFEKAFGYLWNHGDDPQNAAQEDFLDKWEELRNSVLNHGNNQIRLALQDLEKYLYKKHKYQYKYNFSLDNQDRRQL